MLIPTVEEALERGVASLVPELAIYHVTSRVVHRQLLFTPEAKEEFRKFMRMYERFSGCRVLSGLRCQAKYNYDYLETT